MPNDDMEGDLSSVVGVTNRYVVDILATVPARVREKHSALICLVCIATSMIL